MSELFKPFSGTYAHTALALKFGCEPADVWRVQHLYGDAYQVVEMVIPATKEYRKTIVFKQDLPKFILDGLAILEICDVGAEIPEIGKRLTEHTFYIREKRIGD